MTAIQSVHPLTNNQSANQPVISVKPSTAVNGLAGGKMNPVFYIAAAVALISTFLVITRLNAVHALLYLIVSLLSVALIFFILGAHFAAALEVIVYAGAIMVLFVFVIMMLNLGPMAVEQERQWVRPHTWIGPSILTGILGAELIWVLASGASKVSGVAEVTPKEVGIALFGPLRAGRRNGFDAAACRARRCVSPRPSRRTFRG